VAVREMFHEACTINSSLSLPGGWLGTRILSALQASRIVPARL
jgi:hypothetical protein